MKITRLHFESEDDANATAEALAAAELEVALVKERFAGEDDDEAISFVVATPASQEQVAGLVVGEYYLESD